ncbi:MAG: hypothetical protein J1E34_07960 [Oscillospiraceae bacterium]|nr:hypothetical protein [Oscillospiraceae bacterium]
MKKSIVLFLSFVLIICGMSACTPENGSDSKEPSDPNFGVEIADFSIEQPSNVNESVEASRFGMSASSYDNTEAFLSAAAYLSEHPGTKLTVEKGIYYFSPAERMTLSNISNCIIDGEGSEFIFSEGNYFNIYDCNTLLIQNLTIDWNWEKGSRLASLVRVKGVSGQTVTFEFTETDDASFALSTPWETLNQFDPESLTPGCAGGSEFHELSSGVSNLTHLGGNLISAEFNADRVKVSHFKEGQVYLLRHYTYKSSVFYTAQSSKNISYKNINIYSALGAGLTAGSGAHHILFSGITIGLRPGTEDKYRISTTVDAFHIADTAGYFIMENCDISFQGDDCLNVHDNVGVIKSVNGNTIVLTCRATGNFGEGAELTFKNPETYEKYDITAVVTDKNVDEYEITLTVDRELDDFVVGTVVSDNSRNSSNYIIRNCYFHENRARGLLLGSSNGLVENNRFYKTQAAAILIPVDIIFESWMEGTGVENLMIRNNTFDTCDVNNWTALIEFVTNLNGNRIKGECFKNIAVVDNEMIDFPSKLLQIRAVNSLTVSGNVIKNPSGTKSSRRGVIGAENFKNLVIADNIWYKSANMPKNVNKLLYTEKKPDKSEVASYNNVIIK